MRSNFSPARKVLSTTDPEPSDFSFVRTKAPPLPGFTCWNSTIRHVWPSSAMCMPLRNWLVETTSAMSAASLADLDQVLRERGQELDAVLAHDREVLDADASEARDVDPRLDRDDVAGLERVRRLRREARRLVDLQADAVPEPVPELLSVAGLVDDPARDRVGLDSRHPGADLRDARLLRLAADVVDAAQLLRQRAGGERARLVGAVAVDLRAEVGDDEPPRLDHVLARVGVRERAVRARGDRGVERDVVRAVGVHE